MEIKEFLAVLSITLNCLGTILLVLSTVSLYKLSFNGSFKEIMKWNKYVFSVKDAPMVVTSYWKYLFGVILIICGNSLQIIILIF